MARDELPVVLTPTKLQSSKGYDAPSFRDMGFVRDMGGIGAHNEDRGSCDSKADRAHRMS